MNKTFSSIDEQIRKLKSRGLRLDEYEAMAILKMENYYNLINGYKELFIDQAFQTKYETEYDQNKSYS
ncbi:hypothetical protein KK120_22825 [Virgibacillus dakarensis]|nr:hypothetical protein [Virgibacillus dakarensis]